MLVYTFRYDDLTKFTDMSKWNRSIMLPDESIKQLERAYFAAISYMDHEIGRVLHDLEKFGLKENTIVVFTSDHGYRCVDDWRQL